MTEIEGHRMNSDTYSDNLLNCKGYQSLKASVEKDCLREHGEFHLNGCIHCPTACPVEGWKHGSCFHDYCDKFVWILKRVQHYAEKTGIQAEHILDCWEEQRDYWYMNYYQDSAQPLIVGDDVHIFDTLQAFSDATEGKGFRCPNCGRISTNPQACDAGCDWKAYGLFGTLGKGVSLFIKEKCITVNVFKPVSWEMADNSRGEAP